MSELDLIQNQELKDLIQAQKTRMQSTKKIPDCQQKEWLRKVKYYYTDMTGRLLDGSVAPLMRDAWVEEGGSQSPDDGAEDGAYYFKDG
jgi:hypothetical protein